MKAKMVDINLKLVAIITQLNERVFSLEQLASVGLGNATRMIENRMILKGRDIPREQREPSTLLPNHQKTEQQTLNQVSKLLVTNLPMNQKMSLVVKERKKK